MPFDSTDAVRALHLATFGIEPEPAVLDSLRTEVGDDPAALAALADRLYRFAGHLRSRERHSLPDHSQNGELRILLREMMAIGQRHGIIVDVGVLGREGSNSFDLLTDFGWKGLLIEANPALIGDIRRDFGPADFTLLQCAVGPVAGRHVLHIGASDHISSLDLGHAAQFGAVRGTVEVDVRRLPDLLDEAGIPHDFDILDLDIEGLDVAVMNDLIDHSPYRPRLVLIEASHAFTTRDLLQAGLSEAVQANYRIVDATISNLVLGLVAAADAVRT